MSKTLYICSSFNPANFEAPKKNLETFYKNFPKDLGLLVIEVLFPGQNGVLANSKKVYSNSIMWQKERSLNALIKGSWDNYEQILWVDGDILIEDPSFQDKVDEAFYKYDVIQGFKSCRLMSKEDTKTYQDYGVNLCGSEPISGIVYDYFNKKRQHPGLIWGAKTSFLKKVGGLFDVAILGGGDSLFLNSLLGNISEITPELGKKHQIYTNLVKEASPIVGYVDTEIFHMAHGNSMNRRYNDRYDIAKRNGFDPDFDIKSGDGAWEWASHKPAFHQEVKDYFISRNEDS